MGNIVGEDHLLYVKNQIKDRQKILGKNLKTNEDIVWANNKGGWCRLMSSIDISDQDVIRYNQDTQETTIVSNSGSEFRNQYLDLQDYGGPMLAQELILQGGILNYDEPRFGVSDNTSNLPSSQFNYGYGGTEFGLNAMPGLLGFTTKTYDNGSLRKTTIKIKANNKKQFEYLESTYLRLGYTMLLEWGNTTFPLQETNEEGTTFTRYATTGDNAALSLKDEFLYSFDKGQNYFHTRIEELRKESQGNYDAVLGMVDNFDWEFQKDGTYLLTVNLVTIGSVISSLKGNLNIEGIGYPSTESNENEENVDQTKPSETPEEDRPTALEVAIDLITKVTLTENSFKQDKFTISSILKPLLPIIVQPFADFNYDIVRVSPPTKKSLTSEEEALLGSSNEDLNPNNNVIACNAVFGEDAFNAQHYIRLGTLLEFINKKLLLYDQELNPSHIQIDTSKDTYCYSNGWSFPSDPEKLIISYSKELGGENLNIFATPETQIDKFHDVITNSNSRKINVGRVMNLYFNKEYVKSIIKQNTDEEKGLFIKKFIEVLLSTANTQLGNVNKLKLRVTEKKFSETVFSVEGEAEYKGFDGTGEGDVSGTDQIALSNSQFQEATFTTKIGVKQVLEIYDEVTFTDTPTQPTFVVYGFSPESGARDTENFIDQEGSFVTDLNLKTNIDKNLTTQIAIGAQAGGRAVGYDSMIFSKWNVGLVDRVIPSKLDINKAKREQTGKRRDWKKLQNTYREYLFKLKGAKIDNLSQNTSSNILERAFLPSAQLEYTGYIIPNLFLSGNKDKEPTFTRFASIQSNFFSKVMAWDAERKNTVTPFQGFLPVNLSLTFDGLSGIRIFDKLTVDSRFLPKNYTDTLNFIITELDHSFENNKWVTKIGTQSIPKLFPDNLVTIPGTTPLPTPDDIAEVPVEEIIEDAVETAQDEEDRVDVDSDFIPSYFSIKKDVYRPKSRMVSTAGRTQFYETTRGGKEIIPEILDLLNQSPVVVNRFRKFFEKLLKEYPTGYAFTINSATRKILNPAGVGIGSAHVYGLAIDMSVREAQPEGQEVLDGPKTLLYGRGANGDVKTFNRWVELGIPKIAKDLGIGWGGNFRGSTYSYDCVHFYVEPLPWGSNKARGIIGASEKIQESLKKSLPLLKSKMDQSGRPPSNEYDYSKSKSEYLINNTDITNFVKLVSKGSKLLFETEAENIKFRGDRISSASIAKKLGYNTDNNINNPEI